MVTNTGIPEIIQHIGTHLDPPHLYTAVRVCRSWNHALLPFLWTSIDDSLYSWARILDTSKGKRRMESNGVIELDWVRGVFLKYGHLVQHLHVRRREVLDAVCVTRACVELKTFRVGKLEPMRLRLLEHKWMYGLSKEEDQVEMAGIQWKDAMEGDVDSLTFRHTFNQRSLGLSKSTLKQMEVNWKVTRKFWMLLRENQGLQVLRLDESLKEFVYAVSNKYFLEILASLKDLNDLENDFMQVDLAAVLQVVPDLKRYSRRTNPSGPLSLTKPVRWLTHVEINKSTTCQELLQFLRDSPNLESLSILSLCNAPLFDANDAKTLMGDRPSQLRRLQIRVLMSTDGSILDTVLPWIPDLRTIHLTQFCRSHARSFKEYCPTLTTIEGSNVVSIVQATPGLLQGYDETGALERMIMTCPTLKKIDWIGKTLREKSLWDYAGVWPSLTYLRCQIGGLRVYTARYEVIWNHDNDFHDPVQSLDHSVLDERELIRQEQRLVLRRIGSLRNLKTLDIGADFQLHENMKTTWRDGRQSNSWVHKGRPRMRDCLRLSLEMGLGELAELKDLEVFGFEGIEHEIGEFELRWMNNKWKKLKVMRGLCESGKLLLWEEMRKDFRKERLLDFMRRLRPDIVHEPSSVCIMMALP